MVEKARKTPLIFYRMASGREPVREWLQGLEASERRAVGRDLMRAQWRWPVGMPLCRPLGNGLWEIRTALPTKRTARVMLCFYREHLVALHGFIKKTRATPATDLACISHHPTVEARHMAARTSLRLLAVLNVLFKYACARQAARASS